MKNKIFIITLSTIALIVIILASTINLVSADSSCNPTIQIVNQDPIPAIPNDYVKVTIEISNLVSCNKFAIKLDPAYPFSLDSGSESVQVLEQTPYSPNYKKTWDIPYKIRVASDAIQGDYTLRLFYHEGDNQDFSTNYVENDLNISIVDSQTDFSTIIQGVSGSQVSIGVVNIGKNTANSLIVTIPNQNGYTATGINQQILGNLNAGDYSLATFTIVSRTAGRNITRGNQQQNPNIPNSGNFANQNLTIQLDYTDGIGIRRSITKQIPFSLNSFSAGNSTGSGNFTRRNTASSSGISIWWYIGGIIVILIILSIVYLNLMICCIPTIF